MTELIDTGFAPNIRVLQTSKTLQWGNKVITDFDVHPEHDHSDHLNKLQQQFQLPHPLIIQQQVHQNRAIEYTQQPTNHFKHRVDACFTRKKDTICAVMTADCLPVLLADTNGQWVAAIHCGWRSLFQNIIEKTFQKIKAHPSYSQAYLGPCIQQNAYEVDEGFVQNFVSKHPSCAPAFTPVIADKSQADLQHIARIQLEQLDINNIKASLDCTHDMPDKYHSWRRDQSPKRMASLIWMT